MMQGGTFRALTIATAVVAAFATGGTAEATTFFSPTGPWNARLPASPALETNSALIVSTLANKIAVKKAQGSDPAAIETTTDSTPLYSADNSNKQGLLLAPPGHEAGI